MKRVAEIKQRREQDFFKNRMKVRKSVEKLQNKIEIKQNIDLLAPAAAKNRAQVNVVVADVERKRESSSKGKMEE